MLSRNNNNKKYVSTDDEASTPLPSPPPPPPSSQDTQSIIELYSEKEADNADGTRRHRQRRRQQNRHHVRAHSTAVEGTMHDVQHAHQHQDFLKKVLVDGQEQQQHQQQENDFDTSCDDDDGTRSITTLSTSERPGTYRINDSGDSDIDDDDSVVLEDEELTQQQRRQYHGDSNGANGGDPEEPQPYSQQPSPVELVPDGINDEVVSIQRSQLQQENTERLEREILERLERERQQQIVVAKVVSIPIIGDEDNITTNGSNDTIDAGSHTKLDNKKRGTSRLTSRRAYALMILVLLPVVTTMVIIYYVGARSNSSSRNNHDDENPPEMILVGSRDPEPNIVPIGLARLNNPLEGEYYDKLRSNDKSKSKIVDVDHQMLSEIRGIGGIQLCSGVVLAYGGLSVSQRGGQWLSLALLIAMLSNANAVRVIGAADERQTEVANHHPVVEWLVSKKGGYFSDKVTVKNGGIFATQDIVKDELVMMIPPDALLGPGNNNDSSNKECATARRLVYEYATLGESKSKYWPYVQYVFEWFPHATVPIGWTSEGKQLVRDIAGLELPPQWFGNGSYAESCAEDSEEEEAENQPEEADEEGQQLLEAAWRIVLSRGWHQIMVPVFDMVNHRNGKWQNVDRDSSNGASLEVDGDFRIVALKDIAAGTQLHNSYNQCHDVTCFGIDKSYVTPDLFGDYGFVEQSPRRFAFYTGHDDDEELGMVFEFDVPTGDNNAITFNVQWLTEGSPNLGQIAWMEEQWKRLTNPTFIHNIKERAKTLNNESERNSTLEYYEALVTALEAALNSARDFLSLDTGTTLDSPQACSVGLAN